MSENNHYALFSEPSVENIEANRRGRLTLEQQSTLEMMSKSQRSSLVFFGAAILVFVGFIVFFFWQVAGMDSLFSPTSLITIGLVALGVPLLLVVLTDGDPLIMIPYDEIENGQVESVIGRIVWTRGRYRFVSDTRKLKSLRSTGRVLPPPGDYRFFCLPRSGLVVTAQELGLMSTAQPKDLLLDALARGNHFSMEDLQTNRDGSLSGGQEVRLFGRLSFWIVLLAAFILISYIALQKQVVGENMFLYLMIILLGLFVFLRIGWRSISLVWDIWDGKVEHMDGQVTRHIRRGRNTRYYFYQLDDVKFIVPKSAYNALIEGKEYRVYFTPRAKRLVAIEPLG